MVGVSVSREPNGEGAGPTGLKLPSASRRLVRHLSPLRAQSNTDGLLLNPYLV